MRLRVLCPLEMTYQRLKVKVTFRIIHRRSPVRSDASGWGIRRRLGSMQLAITRVVRSTRCNSQTRHRRAQNRRSLQGSRGRWGATVGRMRFGGRVAGHWRSAERHTAGEGIAGTTKGRRGGTGPRKGKGRLGPAEEAESEVLFVDHCHASVNSFSCLTRGSWEWLQREVYIPQKTPL